MSTRSTQSLDDRPAMTPEERITHLEDIIVGAAALPGGGFSHAACKLRSEAARIRTLRAGGYINRREMRGA